MRNYTRFIPGEEIGAVEQWDFGAVDTRAMLLAAQVKVQQATAERAQDEALRQEGYAQGFEQGRAHANLEAQRQMADFVAQQGQIAGQQMARIFEQTQAQLAAAEQSLAKGVLEIACELARQVLRRELATGTAALEPVLHEALGLLMADGKSTVVRLHPSDRDTLANGAPNELASLALTLVADPSITPGGCVIESAGTVVDATLQKRWLRAIATLGQTMPWDKPDESA